MKLDISSATDTVNTTVQFDNIAGELRQAWWNIQETTATLGWESVYRGPTFHSVSGVCTEKDGANEVWSNPTPPDVRNTPAYVGQLSFDGLKPGTSYMCDFMGFDSTLNLPVRSERFQIGTNPTP